MVGLRPLLVNSRLERPAAEDLLPGRQARHAGGRPGRGRGGERRRLPGDLGPQRRPGHRGTAWLGVPRRAAISIPQRPDPDSFRHQGRDILIAPDDIGFWQGAFRDTRRPAVRRGRGRGHGERGADHRPAVRRPRGRPAGDEPDDAAAQRRRQAVACLGRPALERRPARSALSQLCPPRR